MITRQIRLSGFQGVRRAQQWIYFEERAREEGFQFPAGVDEVGRGCLAGPVVAAAVILPRCRYIRGINDSKQLTPEERETAYRVIRKKALGIAVAMCDAPEVDRINILKASLLAMRRAIEKLDPRPDVLLIDGRDGVPGVALPQRAIIGGDGRSQSIAAASIIAKVTRDRMMKWYARRYPEYAFSRNKGYGTEEHREALKAFGPTPLHRRSFAGIDDMGEALQQELLET